MSGIEIRSHVGGILCKPLLSRPVREPYKTEIDVWLRREAIDELVEDSDTSILTVSTLERGRLVDDEEDLDREPLFLRRLTAESPLNLNEVINLSRRRRGRRLERTA